MNLGRLAHRLPLCARGWLYSRIASSLWIRRGTSCRRSGSQR